MESINELYIAKHVRLHFLNLGHWILEHSAEQTNNQRGQILIQWKK